MTAPKDLTVLLGFETTITLPGVIDPLDGSTDDVTIFSVSSPVNWLRWDGRDQIEAEGDFNSKYVGTT